MSGLPRDIKPGVRVCALGHGDSGGEHWHGEVKRLTKTQVVVLPDRSRAGALWRWNRETGRIIPSRTWGGYSLSTVCQKR